MIYSEEAALSGSRGNSKNQDGSMDRKTRMVGKAAVTSKKVAAEFLDAGPNTVGGVPGGSSVLV